MASNVEEKTPNSLSSVCNAYPINHICSFKITSCKTEKLHPNDFAPLLHVSMHTNSSYKKSGSTAATSSGAVHLTNYAVF
jgi:hypothetical protein